MHTTTGQTLFALMTMIWFSLSATLPAAAAPLHEACNADIDKYCSNVTPGDGRIMACLYAHEDLVSDACDEATSDMSDIIDAVLGTAGDAIAICLPDIERHCADTKLGQGRMLSCLDDKSSELTADCGAIVAQFKEHFQE